MITRIFRAPRPGTGGWAVPDGAVLAGDRAGPELAAGDRVGLELAAGDRAGDELAVGDRVGPGLAATGPAVGAAPGEAEPQPAASRQQDRPADASATAGE